MIFRQNWNKGPSKEVALVMLFGDLRRWNDFASERWQEACRSNLFAEVVFVVNREDEDTVREIKAQAEKFTELPLTVVFNRENNIPGGRNCGIAQTRTKYVLTWDDDDSCDDEALKIAYERFVKAELSVMEMPMTHPDGKPFHPQSPEQMPQVKLHGEKKEDLVAIGMVHTPFFATKELLLRIPFPEYVPLRGDWLHWSAELWRAGVPVTCFTGKSVATEGSRDRTAGATASAAPNGFARFHAFVSLLFAFANYRINPVGPECKLLRDRYFEKYSRDSKLWEELIKRGQNLGKYGESGPDGEDYETLRAAEVQVIETGKSGKVERLKPQHDLAPFEAFNYSQRAVLSSILSSIS